MANEVIKQVNLNSELYNIEDETSRGSIDEIGTQVETLETKVTSLETLTPFDTAPTAASEKGVTSGGVKTAIDEVQSNLETFEASVKDTYSETSEDPISGKGVADAVALNLSKTNISSFTASFEDGTLTLKAKSKNPQQTSITAFLVLFDIGTHKKQIGICVVYTSNGFTSIQYFGQSGSPSPVSTQTSTEVQLSMSGLSGWGTTIGLLKLEILS